MKFLDDYTAAELRELEEILKIDENERTDEEQARLDEWDDAIAIQKRIYAAIEANTLEVLENRSAIYAQAFSDAMNTYESMYNAAMERLEKAVSENG